MELVYSPNMAARPIIEDQDMMMRRHLAEAEDHIALSNRIIGRQRELIKKREREGHDTAQSLVLLNTFLDSHSNASTLRRPRGTLRKANSCRTPAPDNRGS